MPITFAQLYSVAGIAARGGVSAGVLEAMLLTLGVSENGRAYALGVHRGRLEQTAASVDPPEVLYRLGRHASRPERLALLRPDGSVSNWFARDDTRETARVALERMGLVLRDDDTVGAR